MKKYIKPVAVWAAKITSALLSFVLIFMFIQPFFVPKHIGGDGDLTSIIQGYSKLDKDTLDIVFLGASQTFCGINTKELSDQYGISSYNYASSAQPIATTRFYLENAIKTQSPKLVVIDVCQAVQDDSNPEDKILSWNYDSVNPSFEKFSSLYDILKGDAVKAFSYTYCPLFLYHNRWSSIDEKDIGVVIDPDNYIFPQNRGFEPINKVEKQKLAYNESITECDEIPPENKEAMINIANICDKKNIKLLFIKIPSPIWTKEKSNAIKDFTKSNNIDFIDMYEHLEEIGIDVSKDFADDQHVNTEGADKVTDYLLNILQDRLK